MIKIVICDDQRLIRDGIRMMLKLEDGITVSGTAQNGVEALEEVRRSKPDIVLMDLKMPVMNGAEATKKIKELYPETKILILTTFDDDKWLFDALNAGASGYLLKDSPREELIKAIKGTHEGKTFIDPSVAGKLINQVAIPNTLSNNNWDLSAREEEILKLMTVGLSNSEISEKIFISEGTVRNHVSTILSKLNVSNRTQAVILAIKHGK